MRVASYDLFRNCVCKWLASTSYSYTDNNFPSSTVNLSSNHIFTMVNFSRRSLREIERLEPVFVDLAYTKFSNGRVPNSLPMVYKFMVETFGATAQVIARLWHLIEEGFDTMPRRATKERFLWALCFLKNYGTTRNMASRCGCDKDTFRKWTWWFLEELSWLEDLVVSVLFR